MVDRSEVASVTVDRPRIAELHDAELARFRAARPHTAALLSRASGHMPRGVPMAWMALDNDQPIYIDHGSGACFTDVDGHEYVDFNASDMAMFCGHAVPAIVDAVRRQAARSTQFLLPTEDSIVVAEELSRRYPVPYWQFTLSATQANTEAIRLARAFTRRDVVLVFQGHYHGHFEEGLVDLEVDVERPVARGLSKGITGRVRVVPFNDEGALEAALDRGDVAIVLTEPAMTNQVHFVAPAPGWHAALRALTRRTGTMLAIDETHTHVVGWSGATGLFGIEPDIVTIGKAAAGGVPLGAYGVTSELAALLTSGDPVATGGTLFGNPLSAAAARAALTEVLIPPAYAHAGALGERLADGIQAAIDAHDLPWTAIRFGPRAGQWYGPEPTTSADALAMIDPELTALIRVWLANRGIWEAIPGAGPTVPLPATTADVDRYVSAYGDLLAALTA